MIDSKKKDSKRSKAFMEKTFKPFLKKYWLVEITLTSGDTLQFYVSAINQFEAYKKAAEYEVLARNEKLRKIYGGDFKLLP